MGQTWGRCGADVGQVWSRCGAGVGQTWDRCGTDMGQVWTIRHRFGAGVRQAWGRCGAGVECAWFTMEKQGAATLLGPHNRRHRVEELTTSSQTFLKCRIELQAPETCLGCSALPPLPWRAWLSPVSVLELGGRAR